MSVCACARVCVCVVVVVVVVVNDDDDVVRDQLTQTSPTLSGQGAVRGSAAS